MRKLSFILFNLLLTGIVVAQENISYQKPSPGILTLADYERAPSVTMDAHRETMLLTYGDTYKTLDDLNQEELRLGGLRINPATRMTSAASYVKNLKLRKVNEVSAEPVQVTGLPENPKISQISWSPDDSRIAFTHTTPTGVELWVVEVASASARRLTPALLNCTLGSPYAWYGDSRRLLVKMLPSDSPALVESSRALPDGPIVSVSKGEVSQNRTYQDLLKNRIDEQNFETLVTSELRSVDLEGTLTPFMGKDAFAWISFSPDGSLLMLTTIEKPYSYVVPYERFPQKTAVVDLAGNLVKTVNEVPLTEIIPKGFSAVRSGRRSMQWRDDKPASLFFVEALDGGDPAVKVNYRDQLFSWDAPFTGEPMPMAKTELRFGRMIWGDDHTAVLTDSWYESRITNTYLLDPSDPATGIQRIFSRNSQDVYSDPGRFETRENSFGRRVLAIEKGNLYLVGQGFSPEGQFPFIDEYNLKSGKTKRLYQFAETGRKEEITLHHRFQKGNRLGTASVPGGLSELFPPEFQEKKQSRSDYLFPESLSEHPECGEGGDPLPA